MNLLCLNCGESFTVDDAVVGPGGGAIKCAHCGLEHTLYRPHVEGSRDSSGLSGASEDLLSVPEPARAEPRGGFASTFAKPLSAFSRHRRPGLAAAAESADSTESPLVEPVVSVSGMTADLSEPPDLPDLPDSGSDSGSATSETTVRMSPAELDEWADSIPDISLDELGGPFVIKSPAGLALEFPDFQLIDEWARGIDKQDKYFVVDASGASVAMNEFIKTHRPGIRSTSTMSAIRSTEEFKAAVGDVGRKKGGADSASEGTDLMIRGSNQHGRSDSGKVRTTQQFQFKIETEEPETSKKWMVVAVILVAAAVSSVLAVFVFDLL